MANWDFVFAYDAEGAAWLGRQGFHHPAVRHGNHMPTTADMKWALEAEASLVFDYPRSEGDFRAAVEGGPDSAGLVIRCFDWDHPCSIPGKYFMVRGSNIVLSVLIRLCQRCGQLYLCPDTGDPGIVLDASLDAKLVEELRTEACGRADGWAYLFERMYGPGGATTDTGTVS